MEYISLEGSKVPSLGLGTWLLQGADCRRAVPAALDLGYRHIDTAQMYGNEDLIGRALAASTVYRNEVFLTTKVDNHHLTADEVERSLEQSLRDLATDYVDLLLLHWPVNFERIDERLEGLRRVRERNLARHIGVSNFSPSQFETAAAAAPIVNNQVEYHPFLQQRDLLAQVASSDAVLTAYSPLARGAVASDETLRAIGEAHGKTAAQVTLRWLLDQDVLVVPKAASAEHLASNLDVFDFALTPEQRSRIDGLDRSDRLIDPPFAPDWED